MAFHAPEPLAWATATPSERTGRGSALGGEQCILGGERFFMRGIIEIPVDDSDEPLQWGVWAELSSESFDRFAELWTVQGREDEPAHDATLSTALPPSIYPPVDGLPVRVRTRPVGTRPLFEIAAGHPIAEEQRRGISRARLEEIWAALLHQG